MVAARIGWGEWNEPQRWMPRAGVGVRVAHPNLWLDRIDNAGDFLAARDSVGVPLIGQAAPNIFGCIPMGEQPA